MERLVAHPWRGNVRELKNAIERATLLSGGSTILPEHLPPEVASAQAPVWRPGRASSIDADRRAVVLQVGISMASAEREMLRSTLVHTSGNKTRAAKILGISLKTVHNKVKKYQL